METRMKLSCIGLAVSVIAWLLLSVTEAVATHEEYFPLYVGNSWTYSKVDDQSTITFTITGTSFGYYGFDDYTDVCGFYTSDYSFKYNPISDKFLQYSSTYGDMVRYDFSGNTWTNFDPTMHRMVKSGVTCTVPAGTFYNCYEFWFGINTWCGWHYEILAPGVGCIEFQEGFPDKRFQLQSASMLPEPKLTLEGDNPDTAIVTWHSHPAYKYRLWESADQVSWTSAEDWQSGTGGDLSHSKSITGLDMIFYKVEYQLLP